MKKIAIVILLASTIISCKKDTVQKESITTTPATFKIVETNVVWCSCQSYQRMMTVEYYYDTTIVDYLEISNDRRLNYDYSWRFYNSDKQGIVKIWDFATCQWVGRCDLTYTAKIVFKDKSFKFLPEIKL